MHYAELLQVSLKEDLVYNDYSLFAKEFIWKSQTAEEFIKRNFNSCSSKTLKKRQKSHRINNLYATKKKFSRQLPIVPHYWKIIYNL